MIILYVFLLTLMIVFMGTIAPIIQIIMSKRKTNKSYKYVFSDELINYDIEYELGEDLASRILLATRGWVRGPQGNIMTRASFEEKKIAEYSIELP